MYSRRQLGYQCNSSQHLLCHNDNDVFHLVVAVHSQLGSNLTDNHTGQRLMGLWVPELQNPKICLFENFVILNLDEKRMNSSVLAKADGLRHHNCVCSCMPQTTRPPLCRETIVFILFLYLHFFCLWFVWVENGKSLSDNKFVISNTKYRWWHGGHLVRGEGGRVKLKLLILFMVGCH